MDMTVDAMKELMNYANEICKNTIRGKPTHVAILDDNMGLGQGRCPVVIEDVELPIPKNRADRRGNKTAENGITKRFRKQPWRKHNERD